MHQISSLSNLDSSKVDLLNESCCKKAVGEEREETRPGGEVSRLLQLSPTHRRAAGTQLNPVS